MDNLVNKVIDKIEIADGRLSSIHADIENLYSKYCNNEYVIELLESVQTTQYDIESKLNRSILKLKLIKQIINND